MASRRPPSRRGAESAISARARSTSRRARKTPARRCPIRSASARDIRAPAPAGRVATRRLLTGRPCSSISSRAPSLSRSSAKPARWNSPDMLDRERIDIGRGIEAVIDRRHIDVVDVEQQAAAGALRDRAQKLDLAHRACAEGHVGRGIFEQHPHAQACPAPRRYGRRHARAKCRCRAAAAGRSERRRHAWTRRDARRTAPADRSRPGVSTA